ncbi:hypothetical protein VMUT_1813 [Vulcanisaeta moutnovskia 768-28]|mgnify:CR=1 FL=1|uniref:Pyrimidine dimer DNA glycosylase n=1 Tax=Vulcanisaeta moutnovskia (strain 768-28) TaxID=985053 RepID=F0QVB2_VULM7|nr:pyrimidine dimer DNA glycosylase/endonuclease V [Vulcanisaeta moutnovskia]ADY02014.1 hypothetical protein VMUT_1813 [Vulcanisaeta moutnovskia 768-28]
MQVFRPYIEYRKSAQFLDNLRLGKQRVETKQVLLAILRRMGIINDGKRGWVNHPIVLMYYNNGNPYIDDLINYFYALVDEWESRGFRNSISLNDVEVYLKYVNGIPGTPITPIIAREYRRVLLLKDPCYYIGKLSNDEILELVSTSPVYFKGINEWIRDVYNDYLKFVDALKKGIITCSSIFPKRD